jgi:hypothetical protein
MSSTDYLTPEQRQQLLEPARTSIREGLESGQPKQMDPADWPMPLQVERASFVTLYSLNGSLRGCIGALQAYQSLVQDVSDHAYAAAFRDPRFPPLKAQELERIRLNISVLTVPEPLEVASEADLLAWLTPGEDGLILEDGAYRSTFLPTVWSSLQTPETFLRELKRKAGLGPDYWSSTIRFRRYRTESFGEDDA